jgi:hypothetical protein
MQMACAPAVSAEMPAPYSSPCTPLNESPGPTIVHSRTVG